MPWNERKGKSRSSFHNQQYMLPLFISCLVPLDLVHSFIHSGVEPFPFDFDLVIYSGHREFTTCLTVPATKQTSDEKMKRIITPIPITIATLLLFLWTMNIQSLNEEILTQESLLPAGERGERRELWRAIELFFSVSLSPPLLSACAVGRAAALEWWALPAEDHMKDMLC